MSEQLVKMIIDFFGNDTNKLLIIFIISLCPILELRGGILAASEPLLGIPAYLAFPICFLGNILPIPFILLLIKKLFSWMKHFSLLKKTIERFEKKVLAKSDRIKTYEFWGLVLFVGIPLPGTGAWTGALIAALLELDFKKAFFAITLGLVIATGIMSIFYFAFNIFI